MNSNQDFIGALDISNPSAMRAADILLQIACDAGAVSVTAEYPDHVRLDVGNEPPNSYRLAALGLFRMVLARIATICLHAPGLEWKEVSSDQVPVGFLELGLYLINLNETEPKYFKASTVEGANIYKCEAIVAVVTTGRKECLLAVQVVNTSDTQNVRASVVKPEGQSTTGGNQA